MRYKNGDLIQVWQSELGSKEYGIVRTGGPDAGPQMYKSLWTQNTYASDALNRSITVENGTGAIVIDAILNFSDEVYYVCFCSGQIVWVYEDRAYGRGRKLPSDRT